jgi:predicted nucleotidyltransferase
MQLIVTLSERKAAEAARRRDAVSALVPVLAEYARTHGGRFLLFGSAARGTMKYHSDVDILMDFPDAYRGEVLHARVVLHRPVAAEDILVHCRANLAKYKVPVLVEVVESIPKTAVGKIDKVALRQAASGP